MKTTMTVREQLMELEVQSGILNLDLEVIINNQVDMDEFKSKFLSNSKGLYFAAQDYRLHKIVSSGVEFSEFEKNYANNKLEALTDLFKHYVQLEEVNIIDDKIKKGKFTLEGLYDKFMTKPSYRLQRIMLITKK